MHVRIGKSPQQLQWECNYGNKIKVSSVKVYCSGVNAVQALPASYCLAHSGSSEKAAVSLKRLTLHAKKVCASLSLILVLAASTTELCYKTRPHIQTISKEGSESDSSTNDRLN